MRARNNEVLLRKVAQYFVVSASIVFFITGIGKLFSVSGGNDMLDTVDPVLLFLTNRQVLLVAGLLEIAVAFALFRSGSLTANICLIAWLTTMFLVYRSGFWIFGLARPCGCLGAFHGVFPISESNSDLLMATLLAYLFVGSFSLLLFFRFSQANVTDNRRILRGRNEV